MVLPQAYTVYFNTDQSVLSPEATATVSQAAAAFKQGGTAVGVRGHADTVGNPELRRGRRRAGRLGLLLARRQQQQQQQQQQQPGRRRDQELLQLQIAHRPPRAIERFLSGLCVVHTENLIQAGLSSEIG
jgi:septum formation inhibitor MinC